MNKLSLSLEKMNITGCTETLAPTYRVSCPWNQNIYIHCHGNTTAPSSSVVQTCQWHLVCTQKLQNLLKP